MWKKYFEVTALNETWTLLGLNWYTTSNHIPAKLHNVCVHGPKQVGVAPAHSIDPLSWSEVQQGERARQNILTPHGDRRNSSSLHQREGGLSCSVWWAERLEAAWSSRVFLPPINKPPKNKQFHPTEKETGQWDKRDGQTGVRKEWHLWQRARRNNLEEMRGRAEDNRDVYERSIRLVVSLFLAYLFGLDSKPRLHILIRLMNDVAYAISIS